MLILVVSIRTFEAEKSDPFALDCTGEMDKARSEARFTCKFAGIEDLFKKNACLNSERFYCQQEPWFISVQPKVENGEKFLGVNLNLHNDGGHSFGQAFSCKTSFELRLLATIPGVADKVKKLNYEFKSSKRAFGTTNLIAYNELMGYFKGYVREDAILVQVHLKAGTTGLGVRPSMPFA